MSRLLNPYVQLMRPLQWIKSVFVIAPIFFAQLWLEPHAWALILLATIAFAFTASAVYILNDWTDRHHDQRHPTKQHRPLAAGTVHPQLALLQSVTLLASGGAICLLFLPPQTLAILGFYLALNVAYSFYFKRYPVLDVVPLACFYVLRVWMGCAAISVAASSWIILATFFLALTIGFAKRNSELQLTHFAASRANLQGYNPGLIICLLGICTTASLLTYAIYTAEKQAELGSQTLIYSVVFVAAGFFRFLSLSLVHSEGGEPEKLLLKDRPLFILCVCWLVSAIGSLSG